MDTPAANTRAQTRARRANDSSSAPIQSNIPTLAGSSQPPNDTKGALILPKPTQNGKKRVASFSATRPGRPKKPKLARGGEDRVSQPTSFTTPPETESSEAGNGTADDQRSDTSEDRGGHEIQEENEEGKEVEDTYELGDKFPKMPLPGFRRVYTIPAHIRSQLAAPERSIPAVRRQFQENRVFNAVRVSLSSGWWAETKKSASKRNMTRKEWEGDYLEESDLTAEEMRAEVAKRRGVPVGDQSVMGIVEWRREDRRWGYWAKRIM